MNDYDNSTWHVFYRTIDMDARGEAGWRRSDYLADSGSAAVTQLLEATNNVRFARAYPGESNYMVKIEYVPAITVTHVPHALREAE